MKEARKGMVESEENLVPQDHVGCPEIWAQRENVEREDLEDLLAM